MIALYILVSVLAFGSFILLHELGHYLAARRFGVTVKEFSIGMGPRLFSRTSKKTGIEYKLCLFPFGGYVSMVGEDEESDDPNALDKKPAWQRFIIMAAGGVTNLLCGVLLVILTVALISPVLAFLLLAVYGKNIVLGVAVIILGIGHIGIHLMHRREIRK